ncbi:hypothetical protein MTO98_26080 [Mucilaginibacter sp. SMC90]|uniref:hypothetical protein n=1 Tax=Mucilaginibacter sp. SMC90 TaxID=2929803 RepID=UPI001FB4AD1F|nr:hypothetical protein [Mucilaginibacter sp. SMC90]UOE47883.1 hypothetical protein MTO98_26080 [Mucilaginibacter sp. SMC90]
MTSSNRLNITRKFALKQALNSGLNSCSFQRHHNKLFRFNIYDSHRAPCDSCCHFSRTVGQLFYNCFVFIFFAISISVSGCGKDLIYREDFKTSIPLSILYNPLNNSNLVTPVITINVNGIDCKLLFDTGSQGLRLIHGALGTTAVDTDQEVVTYGYGYPPGVLEIRGRMAGALIKVGDLPAYDPIRFMRIDDTAGSLKGPWTSIVNVPRLNDKHFRGLAGIFGVGFRSTRSGISNPLAQLPGNGSYIVHFPKYGDQTGNVLINPADQDRIGFTMYSLDADSLLLPNGIRGWKDASLPGAISLDGAADPLPTLLDTGSPVTEAYSESLPFYGRVKTGHRVVMAIFTKSGKSEIVQDFTVQHQVTGLDNVTYNHTGGMAAHMSFGTNLFFTYDVLFDQHKGLIGLRKKTI